VLRFDSAGSKLAGFEASPEKNLKRWLGEPMEHALAVDVSDRAFDAGVAPTLATRQELHIGCR
jgi:hypothetical protein